MLNCFDYCFVFMKPIFKLIELQQAHRQVKFWLGSLQLNLKECFYAIAIYETIETLSYVDGTILIIKTGSIDHILSILKSFDTNIQFTCKVEKSSSIFRCNIVSKYNITFWVYRKATNTDIYINWHSFDPKSRKRATMREV